MALMAPARAARLGRPIDWAAFAAALAVNATVVFLPSTGGVPLFPGADKVIHVAIFAAVGATGVRTGLRAGPLAAGLVTYAGATEVIQAVALAGRTGDVRDWLADAAGVALGIAVGRWTLRLRTGLGDVRDDAAVQHDVSADG